MRNVRNAMIYTFMTVHGLQLYLFWNSYHIILEINTFLSSKLHLSRVLKTRDQRWIAARHTASSWPRGQPRRTQRRQHDFSIHHSPCAADSAATDWNAGKVEKTSTLSAFSSVAAIRRSPHSYSKCTLLRFRALVESQQVTIPSRAWEAMSMQNDVMTSTSTTGYNLNVLNRVIL